MLRLFILFQIFQFNLMNNDTINIMFVRLTTVLFVLLISTQAIDYTQKNSTNVPNSVLVVQYTDNQEYMIALSKIGRQFDIFDGLLLNFISTISTGNKIPTSIGFTSDSGILAIGDDLGQISFYKELVGAKGYETNPFSVLTVRVNQSIEAISFTNNNKELVVGTYNGIVFLYDYPPPSNDPKKLDVIGYQINAIDISPIDRRIIVGAGNIAGQAMILYEANLTRVTSFPVTYNIESVKFTSRGDQIIMSGNSSNVVFYDAVTFAKGQTLTTTGLALYEIAISRNSLYLAVAGNLNAFIFQRNSPTGQWSAPVSVPNTISNIAQNVNGEDLIVVGVGGRQINYYTLCPTTGTFYDSASNLCKGCLSICTNCKTIESRCFSCAEKYYLVGDKCNECTRGCLTCVNASTNCTRCDTAAHFIQVGSLCNCEPKYFASGKTCQKCMVGCLACNNATFCDQCNTAGEFVWNEQSQMCQCKSTYRQQGQNCLSCGKSCLKCDPIQCNTCDAVNHWVAIPGSPDCVCDDLGNFTEIGGKCVCVTGYYQTTNGTCDECPIRCTACTRLTNCTSCKAGVILVDGFCDCPDGNYFDIDVGACLPCFINFCQKCETKQDCRKCKDGLNREIINGTCLCMERYYEDNTTTCLACNIEGCLHCQNNISCTQCDQPGNWIEDQQNVGKCRCKTRYYKLNSTTCDRCSFGCYQCRNPTNCTECSKDRTFIDNRCQCNQTYFEVGDLCDECIFGCSKCDNDQDCLTCRTAKHFVNVEGKCVCEDNHFLVGDECQLCGIIGCVKCSSLSQCETCDSDNLFEPDSLGKCKCFDKYYLQIDFCNSCSDKLLGCLTCSSGTKCLTCNSQDKFEPVPVADLCKCQRGYFLNETSCAQCTIPGCINCAANAQAQEICEDCGPDFQKFQNICKCVAGKFLDGDKCTNCLDHCSVCLDRDLCQSCESDYKLEGGKCEYEGIPVWAIVLIAVGGAIVLGAIIAVVYVCFIKKKPNPLNQEDAGQYRQG